MDDEELLDEIEEIIDLKFQEYLSDERNVETNSADKVLDKYDKDIKKDFLREVKEAGSSGLEKIDVMRIFNVGKSRAYEIQQRLAAQLNFIEYHKRGGKSALTRHKKYAYAEELAYATSKSKKEIIRGIEGSVSEDESPLELLEEKWEELQKKRKNKKKQNPRYL